MTTLIFNEIDHNCTTVPETFPPQRYREGICYYLKRFWFTLTLVSPRNSLTIEHFSSECEIRNERKRQYNSPNYFIIHPLSRLAAMYDAYLCLFYFNAIFFKLIDVAFLKMHLIGTRKYRLVATILNTIDVLSWFNIIFMCFQGVIMLKEKLILIDFRGIIYYRITSLMFWAELISSVPKYLICATAEACSLNIWLFLTSTRLFIIFLCLRPMSLLKQTLGYLKIKSIPVLIIVYLVYLMSLVTHVMACTGFAVSRYRYELAEETDNKTWISYGDLINLNISTQYCYAFFKASAQTFGITIDEFRENENWEESVIAAFNYAVGRSIFFVMWVAVLHVLLTKDLQDTKFQEIISQLKTWMENKELPTGLQKRVVDYYNFYYRKRFFSKKQVQKVLPESLGAKVRVNMHKILKESNIDLFSKLSEDDIQAIGEHFVTEVYSPNDIIIYSGMRGDSFYLLASGSVAVYSHSGKEVCHLYDGAYFGEVSLMIRTQRVTATIIAIETTKVYRIARKYFEKYILSKTDLYDMFLAQAENRLQLIKEVEENYRKTLFAQKYNK